MGGVKTMDPVDLYECAAEEKYKELTCTHLVHFQKQCSDQQKRAR